MSDEPADPIALFDAAVAAINREDWHGVAALCDDASLAAFRRRMLEQLDRANFERDAITAEVMLRHQPDMPREVAEYQAALHRAHTDPARRMAEELPSVADVAALRALSAREVFAAWLDGRSLRRQVARAAAEGRVPPAVLERLRDEMPHDVHALVAIGVVHDGDRIAHVLYRHARDTEPMTDDSEPEWLAELPDDERELALELYGRGHPQVATCRRRPGGAWRLVAEHGFLGLGGIVVGRVVEDGEAEAASDD